MTPGHAVAAWILGSIGFFVSGYFGYQAGLRHHTEDLKVKEAQDMDLLPDARLALIITEDWPEWIHAMAREILRLREEKK